MGIEKLKKLLTNHKNELEEKYSVKEIGIFGSFVRNEQKRGSDLDILVEFNKVPGLFKFINLENYLTDILGVKVDLVRKKAIREELRDLILSEVAYV